MLLIGPPGSGKSDLALRLLDESSACLVSDDQVLLSRHGDHLTASPPAAIAGKLEMRGFGILDVPHEPSARLALVVRLELVATIERMPDLARDGFEALGLSLPMVRIDPASASAAARVRAALTKL